MGNIWSRKLILSVLLCLSTRMKASTQVPFWATFKGDFEAILATIFIAISNCPCKIPAIFAVILSAIWRRFDCDTGLQRCEHKMRASKFPWGVSQGGFHADVSFAHNQIAIKTEIKYALKLQAKSPPVYTSDLKSRFNSLLNSAQKSHLQYLPCEHSFNAFTERFCVSLACPLLIIGGFALVRLWQFKRKTSQQGFICWQML